MAKRHWVTVTCIIGTAAMMVAAEEHKTLQIEDNGRRFSLQEAESGRSLMLLVDGRWVEIGKCSDQVIATTEASDATWQASIVIKNCGATVDYATHVVLADPSGTKRSTAIYSGRPHVTLSWSSGALRVYRPHMPEERVFLQMEKVADLQLEYVEGDQPPGASDPRAVSFSSLNFGATGRAAGQPAELLLRLAGWSQQASGLYRAQWGSWDREPPFGDDPEGASAIRKGFEAFEEWRKRKDASSPR